MQDQQTNSFGTLAGLWGVLGLTLCFGWAIYRLGLLAVLALEYDWHIGHWIAFVGNTAFMAYAEGYKGFQLSFSPRTVARARYIQDRPGWISGLLAPLFCAGYFGAEARTLKIIWIGTLAIVVLVVFVRWLPQPWRGIVDAGVVVGLSWGM
ncbi:MAG: hypothetical protein ACR2P6_09385, partial [Gammaproteobacteria bacterium]